MNFTSYAFAVLYLLALIARWGTGSRVQLRVILLLGLSWLFYAWHVPQYIVLILLSTVVDYAAGLLLAHTPSNSISTRRRRQGIVAASLVINLGMLGWFKYAGLLLSPLTEPLLAWRLSDIVLPIGISFYTFQSLSYTIDVYRGRIPAERRFTRLACYIAFFPQLVAGPIVRAGDFIYQFDRRRRPHWRVFGEGLYLMVRGFFLKIVVADNLGRIVDEHWSQAAQDPQGLLAFSLLVFFACQLFCDFAGYSDIARGIAYQLGFRLPVNFNAPYIASSFAEFWRRWHISLSSWMRDYLYIPLGGSRRGRWRTAANLLIVMLLSGLWHGANWTFMVWGAVLGAALLVERIIGLQRPPRWSAVAVPWFVIVQAVWVFSLGLFRSPDLESGMGVIGNAWSGLLALPASIGALGGYDGLIVLGWWFTLPVWALHVRSFLAERRPLGAPGLLERSAYLGFMLAGLTMLYAPAEPFIYFQF